MEPQVITEFICAKFCSEYFGHMVPICLYKTKCAQHFLCVEVISKRWIRLSSKCGETDSNSVSCRWSHFPHWSHFHGKRGCVRENACHKNTLLSISSRKVQLYIVFSPAYCIAQIFEELLSVKLNVSSHNFSLKITKFNQSVYKIYIQFVSIYEN